MNTWMPDATGDEQFVQGTIGYEGGPADGGAIVFHMPAPFLPCYVVGPAAFEEIDASPDELTRWERTLAEPGHRYQVRVEREFTGSEVLVATGRVRFRFVHAGRANSCLPDAYMTTVRELCQGKEAVWPPRPGEAGEYVNRVWEWLGR